MHPQSIARSARTRDAARMMALDPFLERRTSGCSERQPSRHVWDASSSERQSSRHVWVCLIAHRKTIDASAFSCGTLAGTWAHINPDALGLVCDYRRKYHTETRTCKEHSSTHTLQVAMPLIKQLPPNTLEHLHKRTLANSVHHAC